MHKSCLSRTLGSVFPGFLASNSVIELVSQFVGGTQPYKRTEFLKFYYSLVFFLTFLLPLTVVSERMYHKTTFLTWQKMAWLAVLTLGRY